MPNSDSCSFFVFLAWKFEILKIRRISDEVTFFSDEVVFQTKFRATAKLLSWRSQNLDEVEIVTKFPHLGEVAHYRQNLLINNLRVLATIF